ncbi:MAG: pilus assembly protein PilM [Candidatus Omnitrophica bacterium]|nr:pilus assembly protein PilM [Candidatus Omnitrophota bacterium]
MVPTQKLGIYWGNTGISLVELSKDAVVNSAFVSFADMEANAVVGLSTINADLRLLDIVQRTLRSSSFSVGNAYLSLPSKDIIVRWFVIPWVKPDEVQGMVSFEAKKYLPFAMDELFFNYYPSTITKDGTRKIGIVLTAIRKVHYERYYNVLVQAGINVVYSEPSAMSLLRTMVYRKLVNTEQTSAILIAREESCEIVIASKGHIRFIRDFSLRPAQAGTEENSDDLFRLKFFNEIRMSLDFFSRDNGGQDVAKIIAVSSGLKLSFFDGMSEDVGLPVQVMEHFQVLENTNALVDIGYLRAFGVGLSGQVPTVIDFNLSEGNVHGGAKKAEGARPPLIPPQALLVAAVVCLCAGLLAASWWWINGQMQKEQALKQEVSARLGRNLDTPREDFDSKITLLNKKIEAVKSLPLKRALADFFVYFVKLMPAGMWFDNVDIAYTSTSQGGAAPKKLSAADYYVVKTSARMSITGFASLGDTNAEFELVNQFVVKLRNDARIKQLFPDVKLKSLQARDTGAKQKITAFTIDF